MKPDCADCIFSRVRANRIYWGIDMYCVKARRFIGRPLKEFYTPDRKKLISIIPYIVPPWCPGFEENPDGGGDADYGETVKLIDRGDGTYRTERRLD